MGEVGLKIAGLSTSIATREPELASLLKDRYKGFLSEGAPDWRIEFTTRLPGLGSPAEDVVVRRNGGPNRFMVERYDFVGILELKERSGQVAFAEPDEFSVDSFFRIAYSLALADAGGLLIHAASLIRKGRGYLFCGPSGSGKSTVARLSPDATLLSDELSIVRIDDGRARCYGTPFWGELARGGEDRSAPLVGIYCLHKGSRHAVEALKPRRALERLLPNVMFFAKEPELTARILDISADLVEAVPCFDLSFLPDPAFWKVVKDG